MYISNLEIYISRLEIKLFCCLAHFFPSASQILPAAYGKISHL